MAQVCLEGVTTITNDVARWGPWAGRVVTGDEDLALIFAVDVSGVTQSFNLGIATEDFDVVPPNQDLYCVLHNDVGASEVLKLSKTLLTSYVGDVLITQAGEGTFTPQLFLVHWTGTDFAIRSISLPGSFGGHFEHVTFAPLTLPDL